MKCHLCEKEATWSESPLGNPDELALCDECYKKVHRELHGVAQRQTPRSASFVDYLGLATIMAVVSGFMAIAMTGYIWLAIVLILGCIFAGIMAYVLRNVSSKDE